EPLVLARLALACVRRSTRPAALTSNTVLAVAFDVGHFFGTGMWAGALAPLALLLRAASRENSADAYAYAVQAARRFSRAALIAMLLLTASGVMNAIGQVERIAGLVGTAHGRLLLGNLAVLAAILPLA